MLTAYLYYWDPTYFLVIIGAVICMIMVMITGYKRK